MLPSAMHYLAKDKWDPQTAGFLMMGCFVGGFLGIQAISRVLHRYMPSHVVDCDHTHDDLPDNEHADHHHAHHQQSTPKVDDQPHMVEVHSHATESTPLLSAGPPANGHIHAVLTNGDATPTNGAPGHIHGPRERPPVDTRRPSLKQVGSRVMSFFKDTKSNCDQDGPCFGYSDPCDQECFKHLATRAALSRNTTMCIAAASVPVPACQDEEDCDGSILSPPCRISRVCSPDEHGPHAHHTHTHTHTHAHAHSLDEDPEAQHHHHVPTNALLSIGLQTVIAIALHKFPEGFITYATNHANPSLGLNIFMALFVHNIAEGFAMALPLYMALGSRLKAIAWSSLLGGLSQPLGAAMAVAWFRIANRSNFAIDSTAYACLFAVTAGIMVSVALQLFVESLSLNHNRNLSIFFAFLGMTLLGVSNAFVTH